MVSEDFKKRLGGYGVSTVKIVYRLPDYQRILQEFIWQHEDIYPQFPELRKFLGFWEEKIEGPIHSVVIAHTRLIKPAELRLIGSEFQLH